MTDLIQQLIQMHQDLICKDPEFARKFLEIELIQYCLGRCPHCGRMPFDLEKEMDADETDHSV